jgi:NAD(P)-dependent dehydrogenase (short-subunit alcohol dehydrogenase family)
VAKAVGAAEDLLVVKLDVTSRQDAEAAVKAAVDRFGRIDVLVNNAGNFEAGFFEELTPEQIEGQLATNLIGPMNVTRAVLPVIRKQRSGHVVTIARPGAADHRRPRAAAVPIYRRRRCDRAGRGELAERQQQIDAYRDLSLALAVDEAKAAA